MKEKIKRILLYLEIIWLALLVFNPVFAHQSGCHRWHSCPSDTGSYVCGDTRHCSQCPDNDYCLGGSPRGFVLPAPEPSPTATLTPSPTPLSPTPSPTPKATQPETQLVLVTRVIDGDTIEIQDNQTRKRVRLVGIDAPEVNDRRKVVRCLAKESTLKLRELIDKKLVRLERGSIGDTLDKYGRLLRYAYLDDTNINAEMVKQGYAYAYTKYPFSKKEEFKQDELFARKNQLGLWSPSKCR